MASIRLRVALGFDARDKLVGGGEPAQSFAGMQRCRLHNIHIRCMRDVANAGPDRP